MKTQKVYDGMIELASVVKLARRWEKDTAERDSDNRLSNYNVAYMLRSLAEMAEGSMASLQTATGYTPKNLSVE